MKKDEKLYKQAFNFMVDFGVWRDQNPPYTKEKSLIFPDQSKWTKRLYKLLLKVSKRNTSSPTHL